MDAEHRPMTSHPRDRSLRRLGPLVGLAATLALIALAVLSAVIRGAFDFQFDAAWITLYGGSASLVGAFILKARPGHGVGRVCLAGGLTLALGYAAREAAHLTKDVLPATASSSLVLLSAVAPLVGLVVLGPVLATVYPSGRIGTWTRRATEVLLAVFAPIALLAWVTTPFIQVNDLVVNNPLFIEGLSRPRFADSSVLVIAGYVLAMSLAMVGIALRYRQADAIGRLQIRWVAANFGALLLTFGLVYANPGGVGDGLWFMLLVLVALTPASVAVAILRYRLFDIDRVVSNAVGYGFVTVVLFGVFWAVNLGLQNVLNPVRLGGPLAVAASTLLVAALFNPVRTRVQAIADRRFHRAHYDAERLVSTFASRLRDELDLDRLASELTRTTAGAVEPTTASIWLRAPGPSR
jgi:hypothetical protein